MNQSSRRFPLARGSDLLHVRRGLAHARGDGALAGASLLRQYCNRIASAQNVRTFAWAKTKG